MSAHTPGPWVVDHSHPDWVEGTTIWANDVVIAHAVADQHHETEANARLIASAPELFQLLHDARRAWLDGRMADVEGILTGDVCADAIVKATGDRL